MSFKLTAVQNLNSGFNINMLRETKVQNNGA